MENIKIPEKEKNKKLFFFDIIGWILLITGIIIIAWVLISSYNIFTVKTEAPLIFEIQSKEDSAEEKSIFAVTQAEIQQEIEKIVIEEIKAILPLDYLPKIFNLIAWSILTFILIFGGSQISFIGIKLLRTSK